MNAFFDPADLPWPLMTGIQGLTFTVTTLAEATAQLGSQDLFAPRWFGQQQPSNVNAYALAYDIADTDSFAAFWCQSPRMDGWMELSRPSRWANLSEHPAMRLCWSRLN